MKPVLNAIRRWEEKGLVDATLAERLRGEVAEDTEGGAQRLFQYVLATTGAAILLISGGVFLDWAWPLMTEALRSLLLVVAGLAVCQGGVVLEKRRRWLPVAYLMQTAGQGLMAIGITYSERAWDDRSAAAVGVAAIGLVTPLVLGAAATRRNALMPAVHLAYAILFVGVFLDRATALDLAAIVWILDGLLALSMAGLVVVLRSDPDGVRHPWALNAFAMALYVGFVLVILTGDEALGMSDDVTYALDGWLFLVAAVTVYGIHGAPEGLRRGWFGLQLALCQLAWIPLAFISTIGVADGPPEAAFLAVGGSGIAGFLYARSARVRAVLGSSALSLVIASWYWGVERAGALGAVGALAATAALLFWFSGKAGSGEGAEG